MARSLLRRGRNSVTVTLSGFTHFFSLLHAPRTTSEPSAAYRRGYGKSGGGALSADLTTCGRLTPPVSASSASPPPERPSDSAVIRRQLRPVDLRTGPPRVMLVHGSSSFRVRARHAFRTRRWHAVAGRVAAIFSLIPITAGSACTDVITMDRLAGLDPTTESLVPRPRGRAERALLNVCWRLWIPIFSIIYRATNY